MPITYNLTAEIDEITFTDTDSIIVNAEAGNDSIKAANDGNATLNGGDDHDYLEATNNGVATLNGGLGNDYLSSPFDEGFNSTSATLDGGEGDDILTVSNLGSGLATLIGGLGNDDLIATHRGDAILNGGEGDDILAVSTSTTADANATLIGGAGDDTMTANLYSSTLIVNPTMIGGTGDDNYVIRQGNAGLTVNLVITENADEGTDTITADFATVSLIDYANVENLYGNRLGIGSAQILTGNDSANVITAENLTEADTLNGGLGDDTLVNRGGADIMNGGAGDDQYQVNDILAVINENAAEGIDIVKTELAIFSIENFANVENLFGMLVDGQVLTGNSLNNRIEGNSGSDTLNGGSGDDTLAGYGGSDSLLGGIGNDTYILEDYLETDVITISENNGAGTDTVVTGFETYTLAANLENLNGTSATAGQTLNGNTLNNILNGSTFADSLSGGSGEDTLNGGLGGDALAGGSGNDTYIFGTGDTLTELSSGGIDTVRSSVTHTLGLNLENLTLTGTAVTGTGNTRDNTITGNNSANTLIGLGGKDTLDGGSGVDVLRGGAARDQMTGGTGADDFDFNTLAEIGNTSTARDVITDFVHLSDDIDLATIDASTRASGNQAFLFIGTGAFTGVARQLHYKKNNAAGTLNDKTLVTGDTNGDGTADFTIELTGLITLSAADFIL